MISGSIKYGLGFLLISIVLLACKPQNELETYGKRYQEQQDYQSLEKVLSLLGEEIDTAIVKKILGDPIDMGFDYRYLIDSMSPNGCAFGAVFHIAESGKIDDRWLGEICE